MISLERTRERAIVNQTNIGTVSKATLGELLRDRVEHIYGLFEGQRYHLERRAKIPFELN